MMDFEMSTFAGELHPSEIGAEEWATLLAMDEETFIAWHIDNIGEYDEAYPVFDRCFAYARILADWRSAAAFMLNEVMAHDAHPAGAFLHEYARRYLIKAEALELIAECEGFDVTAERYPDDADAIETIERLTVTEAAALAAKVAECEALAAASKAANDEGRAAASFVRSHVRYQHAANDSQDGQNGSDAA